jgi:hypothetical protein
MVPVRRGTPLRQSDIWRFAAATALLVRLVS